MFNYSNVEHDIVQDEERPKHNIIHFWSLFWIIRNALEFFSFLCSIKIDWFTFDIFYVTCLFAALYKVKIEIIRFTRKVFFSVCSFWSITFLMFVFVCWWVWIFWCTFVYTTICFSSCLNWYCMWFRCLSTIWITLHSEVVDRKNSLRHVSFYDDFLKEIITKCIMY